VFGRSKRNYTGKTAGVGRRRIDSQLGRLERGKVHAQITRWIIAYLGIIAADSFLGLTRKKNFLSSVITLKQGCHSSFVFSSKEVKMKTRRLALCLLLVAVACMLPGGSSILAADLVSMLTQNLGVTPQQAQGGAGAIFDYAKGKLSSGDFSKVAAAVPGMDSLLSAAPATGGAASSLTKLPGSAGSLGGLSSLAEPFSKLGMNPDMVGKFVPEILSYVKSSGGDGVMKILQGVLM
jgi:hypothetical protein